ncbi:sel1 repeat family protein [Amylibacter sp.]|nr:sel1 repeat family protein [Amylibacter sp.]
MSAKQGYAAAQYNLGVMYVKGNGVLQDYAEAVNWWRLSAEQGDAKAQKHLGIMYAFGNGVIKDNLTAHMWLNIASANGDEKAGERRDKLAALMTASKISKATAMARECMKSNYKKCGG